MWHGWAVSAWTGLLGLHEAGQGGRGTVRSGSVRRGEVGSGKAVLVGFVQVRYGQSWSGG